MALLFIDGFDHYDPQALDADGERLRSRGKADTLSALATRINGRRPGSFALRIPSGSTGNGWFRGGYQKNLAAPTGVVTVGAALRWGDRDTDELELLGVSDANHERPHAIRARRDGRLALVAQEPWMGIREFAQSETMLAAGVWHYIELQVVQGDPGVANGSLTVRINGVEAMQVNQQMTRGASETGLRSVFVAARPDNYAIARVDVDDLYITDASGTVNQGFLGDVRIDVLRPRASGSVTQWEVQPGTSTDWQALSDDSDASVLRAAAAGLRHSVAMQALPTLRSPVIHGVQVMLLARKSDAGQAAMRSLALSGAQAALGAPVALLDTLVWHQTMIENDPNGGAPWTPASLAAAEFGAESA
ncbi:hypothetical protein [Serpentinimonas maccroryi]|uniref:hypothetical protein n=1 Tax=Serpentinimonas maccroryi TaxID=1458426 RepID=UPI002033BCCE|nr:hypothetical protein [Serpentinimonas maccroryi]MCM2480208.1 hypothetical protein [Serpentinimonas maccroryi]